VNLREWALPVYTILMQLASGAFLALWIVRSIANRRLPREEVDRMVKRPTGAILCTIFAAMVGSHFHLSRPLLSFLSVLNVRTSWLSREIWFTVLFFGLTAAVVYLQWVVKGHARLQTALGWAAIACGVGGVFCMGEIYLLPMQPAWNSAFTMLTFYGSMALLGSMAIASIFVLDLKFSELREPQVVAARAPLLRPALIALTIVASLAMGTLLIVNFLQVQGMADSGQLASLSLQLLLGLYRPLFIFRIVLLVGGVGWLVVAILLMYRHKPPLTDLVQPTYMACLLVLVAEITGRFLFYATHIRMGI
jgi:anaerobic dimethyl sulfoxide reductase subunit C (anchor subunit)